jgi:hypothetical protein
MDIDELRGELKKNGIKESAIQINPPICAEGILCLKYGKDFRWSVLYVERGENIVNESFISEHDACMYLLRRALIEPTNRVGFKQSDLDEHKKRLPDLLKQYGFEA